MSVWICADATLRRQPHGAHSYWTDSAAPEWVTCPGWCDCREWMETSTGGRLLIHGDGCTAIRDECLASQERLSDDTSAPPES